jgi:hypothetical protein
MQNTQLIEHFTDKQHIAAMVQTKTVNYRLMIRIANHLCRNAEELLFLRDQPTINNCRMAGMMLGLAYHLLPLDIEPWLDN